MLIIFWLILSLIATGLTSYFVIGVDSWNEWWIPVLLELGYFIAIAVVFFVLAYIIGLLTISKKKEYDKVSKFHALLLVLSSSL